MNFLKKLFSGKSEADMQQEEKSNMSLHEEVSDTFEQNVTPEMLKDFAQGMSIEQIDKLTGDDWNNFMEKTFGELNVYMEGVEEGGGVETDWNERLKTYR